MNRKVKTIKIEDGQLAIVFDNGDFTNAAVNMERVAKLLEIGLHGVVQTDEEGIGNELHLL